MKLLPAFPLRFSMVVGSTLLVTAIPLPAQRVGGQWTLEGKWYGTEQKGFYGTAVAGPGDLDFDGYDDLLVGAPHEISNQGVVYAYSGLNQSLLWSWTGNGLCAKGTSLEGAGDLNGDGRPDVVVGAPEWQGSPCGVATLLHDGTVWWTTHRTEDFGISVAGVGDIDLDGCDDVMAGQSREDPFGRVDAGSAFVYSGRDGTLLHRFDGQVTRDYLGQAVGAAGDVNADGWPDLIAGAPQANRGGFVYSSAVYVYSGRDGSLLHEFTGSAANEYLGDRVAGAAFLYSFDPFLAADAITISATSGGPVQIEIAFPATEGGIQVPLGAGPLLSALLGGQAPPNVQGAYGTLDANAQASATITTHPLLASLVGRGFPMAAVSYDAPTLTGRRSSIAWPITVIL